MANHKSAAKAARQAAKRRLHNRYYAKTTRNAIRDLRALTDKKAGEEKLPSVISMVDKLAKRNIIHKNKASNLKSKLMKFVTKISGEAVVKVKAKAKAAPAKKTTSKK